MLQTVSSPSEQTILFVALFAITLLLFLKKKKEPLSFSPEVTSELKGFAILTVLLGHIGYFLFTDHQFLYPFSTISGVGVDMFLFLSGYGLTVSSLKKNYSPMEFYRRRISKIFIPLWLALILILASDALILHRFFDWPVILKSFLGFYPQADIYNDLNSPLWYLTPLLFYYLLFPWIFKTKWPFISALIFTVISYCAVSLNLPVSEGVHHLYHLHYLAFPLGMMIAALSQKVVLSESVAFKTNLLPQIIVFLKAPIASRILRYLFLAFLLSTFLYSAANQKDILDGQLMSITSTLSIVAIFICFKIKFPILKMIGDYSYEIYLLHWPLLYHYGFLYQFLPAGLATYLYIGILLVMGYLFQKATLINPAQKLKLHFKKTAS